MYRDNTSRNAFLVVLAIVGALVLGGNACIGGCGRGYSVGERLGTITKFTKKGMLVKSYEGELVMGGIRRGSNGAGPSANVWDFSTRDEGIATQLKDAMDHGRVVRLSYVQYLISPIYIDTGYDVVQVLPVEEEKK